MLAKVRPEFRSADLQDRNLMRERSLADSPVTLHAFGALMRDFSTDLAKRGSSEGYDYWAKKLQRLSPDVQFMSGNWVGDFFAKLNPLRINARIAKRSSQTKTVAILKTGGGSSEECRVGKRCASAGRC